jgi:hypothetical protein
MRVSKRSRDELPIDATGNGHRMRTMQFDEADALMISHALLIGANTAMMHSACRGSAEQRLRYYRRQFLELVPPGAMHFDADETIAEIAIAMSAADTWSIRRVKERSWSSNFGAEVTVGKITWPVYRVTEEQLTEMIAAIEAFAPLNCTRVDTEDKVLR